MEQLFDLKKVVDPHKHLPEDIADLFLEAFGEMVRGNGSYINYTVGEYLLSLKPGEEDDPYYNPDRAAFDKWMLDHFEKYEPLLILYWW